MRAWPLPWSSGTGAGALTSRGGIRVGFDCFGMGVRCRWVVAWGQPFMINRGQRSLVYRTQIGWWQNRARTIMAAAHKG
jgi:hypothetical protein